MKSLKNLDVNDFDELKRLAYNAALQGQKQNYSEFWEARFMKSYFLGTIFWHYEEVVNIYRSFLAGEKTESEAKELLNSVQEQFDRDTELFRAVNGFMEAENKAFSEAGIKYGTVEFKCPICGGQAYTSREYTPDNIAHQLTMRSECQGCGFRG